MSDVPEGQPLRTHGAAPYNVVLLHGGPGAPGGMAPLGRELAADFGVLEPFQTADTIDGQVAELAGVITAHGAPPVALVGSSWGAMLGFIFAARHPELVRRLVMVGSGVFDPAYETEIKETRLKRLPAPLRFEATEVMLNLDGKLGGHDKDGSLARLGQIFTTADLFDPLTLETEVDKVDFEQFRKVWSEAVEMRQNGELVTLGKEIKCPVLALHGDYDPHPAEGVRRPLSGVVKDFRFVLLSRCGHLPWLESQAADAFYRRLRDELSQA